MVNEVLVPTTIQVGAHTYEICLGEGVADSGDYGAVNHRLQQITLNPKRPYSQQAETLMHELLHIIDFVFCGQRVGEENTGQLSEGMAQVMQGLGITFDFRALREK